MAGWLNQVAVPSKQIGETMPRTIRARPVSIRWDKEKCTTCLSCMVVCAERHTGVSALSRSRIRVLPQVLGGDYGAEYCRQCRNAPCAAACPEEAIQFDQQLRTWIVHAERCTGCGACVEACPFDAIQVDQVSGVAAKCDLCAGAAWCVQACPTGALTVAGRAREGKDGK